MFHLTMTHFVPLDFISGWALYCSPHTPGLVYAPSCSPNIQVNSYFFLPFTFCWFFTSSLCLTSYIFVSSCGVLSRLRRMEPGAVPSEYSQLLDCLCRWGQVGDVLELVTDWLTEALPKKAVSQVLDLNRSWRAANLSCNLEKRLLGFLILMSGNTVLIGTHILSCGSFCVASSHSHIICCTEQGVYQSNGAYPGDGGGQTRPGTGLPGLPVQSHLNAGERPGSQSGSTEAAPYGSGLLEGMTLFVIASDQTKGYHNARILTVKTRCQNLGKNRNPFHYTHPYLRSLLYAITDKQMLHVF